MTKVRVIKASKSSINSLHVTYIHITSPLQSIREGKRFALPCMGGSDRHRNGRPTGTLADSDKPQELVPAVIIPRPTRFVNADFSKFTLTTTEKIQKIHRNL